MKTYTEEETSQTFCKTHNENFKELWPDFWCCEMCFMIASESEVD